MVLLNNYAGFIHPHVTIARNDNMLKESLSGHANSLPSSRATAHALGQSG